MTLPLSEDVLTVLSAGGLKLPTPTALDSGSAPATLIGSYRIMRPTSARRRRWRCQWSPTTQIGLN